MKNILDAVKNNVYIRNWLGNPCNSLYTVPQSFSYKDERLEKIVNKIQTIDFV